MARGCHGLCDRFYDDWEHGHCKFMFRDKMLYCRRCEFRTKHGVGRCRCCGYPFQTRARNSKSKKKDKFWKKRL